MGGGGLLEANGVRGAVCVWLFYITVLYTKWEEDFGREWYRCV